MLWSPVYIYHLSNSPFVISIKHRSSQVPIYIFTFPSFLVYPLVVVGTNYQTILNAPSRAFGYE